ncbi:MAG: FMNH2-utilizing oxygenase, partial [Frankiales bacterium]|nr:FMNH2-utilizing oxygenase [Frankiales bacterium]
MSRHLHLALALDGAGWHPASWRDPSVDPQRLLDPRWWVEVVRQAQAGLFDLVTIEDTLGLQSEGYTGPDQRTDQVRGRFDAVLLAARIAPLTQHIGIVPTAVVTHTEPFHVSKALATLDYVSTGRAGWRVRVTAQQAEAALFGRRTFPPFGPDTLGTIGADLFDEAADAVEVARRLWDSWEDDAVIKDAATGRFIDRDKLHYIDFVGKHFSVKGPSIVPRPPQGQLPVTVLAHGPLPYAFAARQADVVFTTPQDDDHLRVVQAELGTELAVAGRPESELQHWADVLVVLADTAQAARDRKERLDALAGAVLQSDARIFVGTPVELADLLEHWNASGLSGFRLRPATVPLDVPALVHGLVPELQRRDRFRTAYTATTLRGHLGLAR